MLIIKGHYNYKTGGSFWVKLLWSVSLGDLRRELSLQNNLSPENGNGRLISETFSSHVIKVLLDSVTKTVVQLGRLCASH